MTHLDINIIVASHFGISTKELMHSGKYSGSYPRYAAMLICNQVLKASTIKLALWYNKHQHTTPMRSLRGAHHLLKTDPAFEANYQASLTEVLKRIKIEKALEQATNITELEKKTIKQIYNLNHRVREKGIVVRTRSRTLSINETQLSEIQDSQLKKLLDKHNYAIQLSII